MNGVPESLMSAQIADEIWAQVGVSHLAVLPR